LEIWLVSFIGGFVGSVLMDITESKMAKFGISSGVTVAYIGRWAKGLINGVYIHENIANVAPVHNEVRTGLVFHFVAGGGVVALFYPVFLLVIGFDDSSSHLALATIFGLFTSGLPWFILMPSFGWGIFGLKAPAGSRPVISPMISHIPYGFGIGLTLVTYYAITA
jgi:hypothetical protein